MKAGKLIITPEERDELLNNGYCKIDDPERGEIEVRILSDEPQPPPGPKLKTWLQRRVLRGLKLRMKVIRAGTAAMLKRKN
jgi:hypothetical protein